MMYNKVLVIWNLEGEFMENLLGISLIALMWGAISAASLPIGAAIGILTKPTKRVTSSLMAFGGGALLFALTIELFGHSLHASEEHLDRMITGVTIIGALFGGVLFELLNRALNAKGGFLRNQSLVNKAVTIKKTKASKQLLEGLSQIKFLQILPPEKVANLIPSLNTYTYKKGEQIFKEGDIGDQLYFIVKGSVKIFRGSSENSVHIDHLEAGDIFGEIALVSDKPRTATITAETNLELYALHKHDFVELLRTNPALQEECQKIVSERIHAMSQKDELFLVHAAHWHEQAIAQFKRMSINVTDKDVSRIAEEHKGGAALAIWLGIALDGIPESLVIGMLVTAAAATGNAMSLAFIVGVFLANLPEAMSSAVTMQRQGKKIRTIMLMWFSLCVTTGLGAFAGAFLLPAHPTGLWVYGVAAIEGVAAGAMLTMIANTMLPEAFEQGGGTIAGLSTLIGFVAALSVKLIGG